MPPVRRAGGRTPPGRPVPRRTGRPGQRRRPRPRTRPPGTAACSAPATTPAPTTPPTRWPSSPTARSDSTGGREPAPSRQTEARNARTRSMSSADASGSYASSERVGEEVLVAGIDEQLGGRRGVGQLACGRQVLVEELVALLAVDLHRHPLRPRLPELRDRDAGVHEQCPAGTGPGLREPLGDRHAEGESGVDEPGVELVGRGGAALPDRVEPGRPARIRNPPRCCRTCGRRTGRACARCARPRAGRRRRPAPRRSGPGCGGTAAPRPCQRLPSI